MRDAQAAGDATEQSRLNTQESLLADIAKSRFDFDTADADQRLDEISYAIGVSKEQLTMNKERLGASLAAATASIDDQLLALDQAKYKADYNAHAARMLPPEFAPDAKAPYDVPLPKYIEPRPGAAPAPAYQAQYVAPPEQGGLSQAPAIGGAALGIAAIPFTLGASLGASAAAVAGLATTSAASGCSCWSWTWYYCWYCFSNWILVLQAQLLQLAKLPVLCTDIKSTKLCNQYSIVGTPRALHSIR